MTIRALCASVVFLIAGSAWGQPFYNAAPDWVSADTDYVTGCALADLDRDGWLDLIVSNGNDMNRERLVVYYNAGNGTLPIFSSWQSADIAYNGHLDVADVNGDGWPDVAVARLGAGSTNGTAARLYLNNQGTLSSTPDWQASEIANAFSCAFGDMNNDGRPDLAVGTGWAYSPQVYARNYVYLNVGGMLSAAASWMSDDTYHYQGVNWVDADGDGWLDLVGIASRTETQLYRNLGGLLETTASWHTADGTNKDGIIAITGDVTGDGLPELITTDNSQLGGSGRFRQYDGLPGGFFTTTATWTYNEGYTSVVALADVNRDGRLDLATGAWWDNIRIFLNTGSGFGAAANWSSSGTVVGEKIVFGDLDEDGRRLPCLSVLYPPPGQHLFQLPHQPIDGVECVAVDGIRLTPAEYTFDHETGWLTVGPAPRAMLFVRYLYTLRPDMVVTSWDPNQGNYVFYHLNTAVGRLGDLDGSGTLTVADWFGWPACWTAPDVPGAAACNAADVDLDDDVDLADFAVFAPRVPA